MSSGLFKAAGKDYEKDAKDYVRIYSNDERRLGQPKPKTNSVNIYFGSYGHGARHVGRREHSICAGLFAVLDLVPPHYDGGGTQSQWIFHVDEFKVMVGEELASIVTSCDK